MQNGFRHRRRELGQHRCFNALSELSEFKKAAVSYISGYAGMMAKTLTRCEICCADLEKCNCNCYWRGDREMLPQNDGLN